MNIPLFPLAFLPAALAATADQATERLAPATIAIGQTYTLELDSNPSTGYGWQLSSPLPENSPVAIRLSIKEPADIPQAPPIVGRPAPTQVTVTGIREGEESIRLIYIRPWEKGAAPLREIILSIRVTR